jgi:hypothetical protein
VQCSLYANHSTEVGSNTSTNGGGGFGGIGDDFFGTTASESSQTCESVALSHSQQLALLRGVSLPSCTDSISKFSGGIVQSVSPMCAPSGTECSELPVFRGSNGSAYSSPACSCLTDQYAPATRDAALLALAPYDLGCVAPLRGVSLTYTSPSVTVALQKTADRATSRSLNLTVQLSGSSSSASNLWEVANASSVPDWLELQQDSGSLSQGQEELSIPLSFHSSR